MFKQFRTHHGNMNVNMVGRMFEHADLYTMGSVAYDMIDFSRIEKNHYLFQKLIYEEGITDAIQNDLEKKLPLRCRQILQLIDNIVFRGDIPNQLNELITPTIRQSERLKYLKKHKKHSNINNNNNVDGWDSDDSSIDMDGAERLPRRGRADHFRELYGQDLDSQS